MERDFLRLDHWRKSGQFFMLNRAHATVVVQDDKVGDTHVSYLPKGKRVCELHVGVRAALGCGHLITAPSQAP